MTMSIKDFSEQALRTESIPKEIVVNVENFMKVLKMCILMSDTLDAYKKAIFYGKNEKLETSLSSNMEEIREMAETLSQVNVEAEEKEILNVNVRVLHGIMGSFTESGELVEALVEYLSTGNLDGVNIGEEIADGRWYDAILVNELNLDWDVILSNVIEKLRVRYPEKFDSDLADNRNLELEREKLENG